MNKLYILTLSLLTFGLASVASAQGTIYKNGADVSGTTITVSTSNLDSLMYPKDLYFVNEGSNAMDLRVRRVLLCNQGDVALEQLCYNWGSVGAGLCFQPSTSEVDYTTPTGGASPSIGAGDTLGLQPKQDGNGNEAAVKIALFVVDEASGNMLDSVYINYIYGNADCTASIEEEELTSELNAYPNPANDIARIKIAMSNNANAELVIVDMLGKQVYNRKVAGSNTTVNVNTADFNQGIYFYSLKVNNQIIETKKLVVKH